jgi:hypothetical protein
MDQGKLEEIMEFLKAIERKRGADKAEAKREREADKAEMKAQIGGLASRMDVDKAESEAVMKADHEEIMAGLKRMNATLSAWLGGATHACFEEEKEPTPEETAAVEKSQGAPNGAADEETSTGTEDRTGEQCLACEVPKTVEETGPGQW